ncbi:hypothetical protein F5878DRAFT_451904 [Lentinula raphanica]|uniref:Uncharacterized protein n=1 Tax=Lentinula raphanica TaxID=153919 RepID=A0AA38U6N7_9AGAR|nr:hypothetical protein F5878DRAFT_451904 [Lentinula raphanica]
MTRSNASPSAASHALAILILGATISSGVLAAPTRSPMIPSSMGAQTYGLSLDGPVPLSEGHTLECTTLPCGGVVHANIVAQQKSEALARDNLDDSENGTVGGDPSISLFFKQRVDLLKRGNVCSSRNKKVSCQNDSEQDSKNIGKASPGPSDSEQRRHQGILETLENLPTKPKAEEQVKIAWFEDLEARWQHLADNLGSNPEENRVASVKIISEYHEPVDKLISTLDKEQDSRYNSIKERAEKLRKRFRGFLDEQTVSIKQESLSLIRKWEYTYIPLKDPKKLAPLIVERRQLYDQNKDSFRYAYAVAEVAEALGVLPAGEFAQYKELFDDWHLRYSFDPL